MHPAAHPFGSPNLADAAPDHTPSPVLLGLGLGLLCGGVIALLFWSGSAVLFRYAAPVLALALGAVLYRAAPVLYVGFAWWMWFLAPFVRRVIDYQAGWQDPNVVLLIPFLVGGLPLFGLLRNRSVLLDRDLFPFTLALLGILYGFAVGLVRTNPAAATFDLLKWMVPVLFGLHMALHWQQYPALRRCVQRTFLWGVAGMGLYAVLQFYALPAWDANWMIASEMGSIGRPLPFEVRIFSTMNSPSPFAATMMAGLLILFSTAPWKHLAVAVPGYAGFLLTLVRSAWGGWMMALLLMAFWIKGRLRARLVGVLLLGFMAVVPALTVPQISQRLSHRFESFEDIEEDKSFNARLTLYRKATLLALTNPVGEGIGAAGTAQKVATGNTQMWDSGLLILSFQMGWPGLLLMLGSLGSLMVFLWHLPRRTGDDFVAICSAIAFAVVALMLFKNALTGASGALFWGFAGLAVAGHRYHQAHAAEAPVR